MDDLIYPSEGQGGLQIKVDLSSLLNGSTHMFLCAVSTKHSCRFYITSLWGCFFEAMNMMSESQTACLYNKAWVQICFMSPLGWECFFLWILPWNFLLLQQLTVSCAMTKLLIKPLVCTFTLIMISPRYPSQGKIICLLWKHILHNYTSLLHGFG